MKPTTTSVFVSPVRPHCQSRTLQESSGRAAGAQWPCLPAAQDGQTKSWPRLVGRRISYNGCGAFLAGLLSLSLSAPVPAGVRDIQNLRDGSVQPLAGKSTGSILKNQLSSKMPPVSNAPALTVVNESNILKDAVQPLTGVTPESKLITEKLAQTCQNADDNAAPAMVAIRPGRFNMGSPDSEKGRDKDESPQHQVTIPKPFALSRCEITVGQFRQFINESGYKTTAETDGKGCYNWDSEKKSWQQIAGTFWDKPSFSQTDKHPVVCVSWHDAQRYVDWLSHRTGALYRLPTEAEWEYAARADTESARYYVDNKQCEYANGLGQESKGIAGKDWVLADCTDPYVYIAPVASFGENQFGLFDMLGNALEWTLDCYHDSYKDAPFDGTAWLEQADSDCGRRVVRGGSWGSSPRNLRSAGRYNWYDADAAYDILGFRAARAL